MKKEFGTMPHGESLNDELVVSPEDRLPLVCRVYSTSDLTKIEYEVYSEGEDGSEYRIYADGRVAHLASLTGEYEIVNPRTEDAQKIMIKAHGLRALQVRILEAREQLAKKLADGDLLREKISHYAIKISEGRIPEPWYVIEGVKMYKVGENASHAALMGTKDNRLFFFCDGPEVYVFSDETERGDEGRDEEGEAYVHHSEEERLVEDVLLQFASREASYYVYDVDPMTGSRYNEREELSAGEEMRLYEESEARIMEKYRQRFHDILGPLVKKYMHVTDIHDEENIVSIPLDDGTLYTMFLKRKLVDVTHEESIYIGRGNEFLIREQAKQHDNKLKN